MGKPNEQYKQMDNLSESLEMYLKAIYLLSEENNAVQAKDISWHLEVTRPSVTGALRQLSAKKLVNYSPYEAVTLTPKGKVLAKDIVKRFEVLQEFFTRVLGIEDAEAKKVACGMEHAIPGKLLGRLTSFLDYMMGCPRGNVNWDEKRKAFYCGETKEHEPRFCRRKEG